MQRQSSMRPSPQGGLLRSALLAGVVLGAATAQAANGDETYTILKVKTFGDIEVGVSIGGFDGKAKKVHVNSLDSTATVAANVASAVGNGAKATGNKVTVPRTASGDRSLSSSLRVDDVIVMKLNIDKFSLGTSPAGILFFASNPDSGRDTLDSDATISAGFASGLDPVSFVAPAGQTTTELTAALNAALDSAGYVTKLLDARDIEVFANGASGPTELDFSVDPAGPTADGAIVFGMQTAAVPEPGTWTLMLAALGLSGLFARRRQAVRP